MTERDISIVEKVTQEFKKHRENEDVAVAVRLLRKAKPYLDRDGNVASYAKSAVALQEEMELLFAAAESAIKEIATKIESVITEDDEKQVATIESFNELRNKYKPIRSMRKQLSSLQSKINANKLPKNDSKWSACDRFR